MSLSAICRITAQVIVKILLQIGRQGWACKVWAYLEDIIGQFVESVCRTVAVVVALVVAIAELQEKVLQQWLGIAQIEAVVPVFTRCCREALLTCSHAGYLIIVHVIQRKTLALAVRIRVVSSQCDITSGLFQSAVYLQSRAYRSVFTHRQRFVRIVIDCNLLQGIQDLAIRLLGILCLIIERILVECCRAALVPRIIVRIADIWSKDDICHCIRFPLETETCIQVGSATQTGTAAV